MIREELQSLIQRGPIFRIRIILVHQRKPPQRAGLSDLIVPAVQSLSHEIVLIVEIPSGFWLLSMN